MAASGSDRPRQGQGKSKRPDFRRHSRQATPVVREAKGSPGWKIYFLGLLAIVGVVVLTLQVIWPFLQSPVPLVAIAMQYHDWPLSPNSLSKEDLDAFESTFAGYRNVSFKRLAADCLVARSWTDMLRAIEPGGPRRLARQRQGAIIYISGHGAVDKSGNACLLLPGYRYADYLNSDEEGKAWLRVRDILSKVCESDHLQGVDKLLVFDVGKMELNWSIGLLHNSFCVRLGKAVKERNDPHLAVLCAADDGERAWTDPNLRESVFGHFFRLGLQGAASDSRKVTLRDLESFVRAKVPEWVGQRFGAQQQNPKLIASTDELDFDLAYVAPKQPPPDPPQEMTVDMGESRSLWDKYAEVCRDRETVRTAPPTPDSPRSLLPAWSQDVLNWACLEGKLVRYEQMLMAGDDYRQDAQDLRTELNKLFDRFLDKESGRDMKEAEAEASRTLRQPVMPVGSLSALALTGQPSAESAFEAWKEVRKQPPANGEAAKPLPPDAHVAYDAACWFAYDRARSALDDPTEDWKQDAGLYLHFLDEQAGNSGAFLEPGELWLLRWGIRLLEGVEPAHGLGQALEVHFRMEQATTVSDPRVAYLLSPRWDSLSAQVRKLEDALFSCQNDGLAQLRLEWNRLLDPANKSSIPQCEQLARELEATYQARDQAFAWLPSLGIWLDYRNRVPACLPDTPATATLLESWYEAVEHAHGLNADFIASGRTRPTPG